MYLKVEISRHLVILLFVLINTLASPGDGLDLDLNLKLEDGILFSQFYDFATKHGRQYLYNSTELLSRFKVFKDSAKRAELMNHPYGKDKKSGPVFGINKFADLTPSEFKAKYLSGLKKMRPVLKFRNSMFTVGDFRPPVKMKSLPPSVDWRKKSVLSPVIDQKGCGACWAFSMVHTMEAMLVISNQTKSVDALSAQEVIDCAEENNGCDGGDICDAAIWAQTHGIVPEKKYPLERRTGTCKKISEPTKRVKVADFRCEHLVGNENEILQTLAFHGPVMVVVDATTWHNYIGGIIRFHCSDDINHAVQIVGYNLEGEVPYYIVRNSWGSNFGDNGYLYLRIGNNLCGVANQVVKLTVSTQV
ncbi:hypothetical protein RRG08_001017 [Elysia crispata]|uniref:Cathepsin O n=1 Tax=Elysia crispata TaxID=231223 RepID=A0AAE1E5E3_9GAST|nr:hypothetical protein RRG08_001017 [Elysia crispata]